MKKSQFRFDLPHSLIASEPVERRSASRLMRINPKTQSVAHHRFAELVDFCQPQDCLIFNNTKVVPARLFGTRDSGGKVELLLERLIHSDGEDACLVQIRASNSPKPGTRIWVKEYQLEVVARQGRFYRLANRGPVPLAELFERHGEMPLPPYIERAATEIDKERYQTVYAKEKGAVAAPTAGLHFDQALLEKIRDKRIRTDFVTLHVGAGTFTPVTAEDIRDHQMHSEYYEVPESVVKLVAETRRRGGRVIAVGTTSVRCLESAAQNGELRAARGETDIFIYPGYRFRVVDALITNFHLSESSLLMLVSAFAGREFVLSAYQQAIAEKYRFFSYGDSMFIEHRESPSNVLAQMADFQEPQ